MKKWTTTHNLEILQVLNGRSYVFFVWNGTSGLLVDTGKNSSWKKLNKNLQQLKIEGKTIDFLALTHTHYDHCQNAATIQVQENCKILASKKEAEFCKNGFTPLPSGTLGFFRMIVGLGNRLNKKRFSYKPFEPDIIIENELELQEFGGLIRITSTPGHTEGSLSILVDNEIALVGDTLFSVFRVNSKKTKMKQKQTITILAGAILVLSIIAALVGIFSSGGPGVFDYETIRGETVTIYGIWVPFYVQF